MLQAIAVLVTVVAVNATHQPPIAQSVILASFCRIINARMLVILGTFQTKPSRFCNALNAALIVRRATVAPA